MFVQLALRAESCGIARGVKGSQAAEERKPYEEGSL